MELKVIDITSDVSEVITLNDEIFTKSYNEALIHQVITAFLANARSGTRAQKQRNEVNKSTRKPFKQKGTGRARAGMASSPLWRGGGRIFPNRPDENFTQKINRRMYRMALLSIISQSIRDNKIIIVKDIEITAPKTKEFIQVLDKLQLNNSTNLFIVNEEQFTEELFLSSRNLFKNLILESHQIDPYHLVRCQKIIITKDAILKLQEQWV